MQHNAGQILSGFRASEASASVYQGAIARERAAVVALAEEWENLRSSQSGPTAFQSHAFCLAWLDAHVYSAQPDAMASVVTIRNMTGALVALFPLAVSNRRFPQTAEWIGEPIVQYGDALIDPTSDAEAIRVALSDVAGDSLPVDAFHFRKVRDDSRIASLLRLDGYLSGEKEEAAVIELHAHDSFDAYQTATFSNRSRKNRRKRRRTLEAEGTLTFALEDAPRDVGIAVETAIAWKREWLAERGLTSRAFADDKALATLTTLAKTPGTGAVAGVLRLNGAPVAIEFGFQDAYGYLGYLGSYNPFYDHLSPGKIAMEELAKALMDDDCQRYDLMAPNSEYKQSWTNSTHPVGDYLVPLTFSGYLYAQVYLKTVRPALKAVFAKAPGWAVSTIVRLNKATK